MVRVRDAITPPERLKNGTRTFSLIAGHSLRVAFYAVATGAELGLNGGKLKRLWMAAALHDVGKILVPRRILLKRN